MIRADVLSEGALLVLRSLIVAKLLGLEKKLIKRVIKFKAINYHQKPINEIHLIQNL